MADSRMRYCRLCHGPCDDCEVCLRNPDRFKPSTDMIKIALEKKGAFTSSTFCTTSSDPPEILVSDGENGGTKVDVRLKSMLFISEYRNPKSLKHRELAEAAREEIIRSFDLPRDRVGDGDIEIDIREGSIKILMVLNASIITIAAVTIAGLCSVDRAGGARAPGANVSENGMPVGPPGMLARELFDGVREDIARKVKQAGSAAGGAVLGATAGAPAGPVGMAVGGAVGGIVGGLFG
ncbi:PREDICTED: uncharacterized protein LOC109472942 [Branchiostoma belcheri]|uniref:Uncharacterized protein LOC109472942 n=1 Tax=Branchiostoma belcheri TaxID=7741 RepID=A0A6P4ZFA8_BRABE|nr:PREDICTED: uncharacterized protein LOC109472942 [Branchiostoma belcheri]